MLGRVGTVLRGGVLVEFEPARVERAELRVDGGKIVARAESVTPVEGDDVVDVTGKLVVPGLVAAHHRLCETLMRGMPGTHEPREYEEHLNHGRYRFAPHLSLDDVQLSAALGGLECLSSGTTTVVEHHSSPGAVSGSLLRAARGLFDVGLRAIVGYEVTDRLGPEGRDAALEESRDFIGRAQGRFRGMVAMDAASQLSDDTLAALGRLAQETGRNVSVLLAEDPLDERLCTQRFGRAPLSRLLEAGLVSSKSLMVHAAHLSWQELAAVIATGAWFIHTPRSDMQLQVGYAPAGKLGARTTVGPSGVSGDVWADVKLAHLRAREAGAPVDVLRYIANGHRLVSEAFGCTIGRLEVGATADLLVMDYVPATPLTAKTLAAHVVNGLGARWVESVMVDGVWRQWARRPLSLELEPMLPRARQRSEALWQAATALK
jgi:cytosine/adenosine deaminase-related metal-dependent hydrolase